MRRLFILVVLSIGYSVYAQDVVDYRDPDHYVVRKSGDTISGKLKYGSSEDIKTKITVKVNDTLKYNIKAADVLYFKDGEKEYTSFQPDGETEYFFLKYWEVGKYLELYEWQVPLDLTNGRVEYIPYVRKGGDRTFVELSTSWTKHFVEFIDDYEELANDVWHNKYKIEQLGDVVKKYNEWKAENK